MIDRLRSVRTPPHIGILLGLSTGAYAMTLGGVTLLQSISEAALIADRTPAVAAIQILQQQHTVLDQRLARARSAYEQAAAAYASGGTDVATLEASLAELASAVSEIKGSAASLPTSFRLPAISTSVRAIKAPAVHTNTAASGG